MSMLAINKARNLTILLVIINVAVGVIQAVPCGNTLGSPPPSSSPSSYDDRIYFKPDSQGIQTIDINGTIYACYPDGTMIKTQASSESSEEVIEMPTTRSRPVVSLPTVVNGVFRANGSRCSENGTFCTELSRYPTEHVNALLKKAGHKFIDQFGTDELDAPIGVRFGSDDEQLCDSYEEVIYPTEAQRRDESWLFILNTNRQQGVRISKCRSPSKPCRMADSFPEQYRSECKQLYMYRELVALSPDGSATKDKFKLPSCCSCVLHTVRRNDP